MKPLIGVMPLWDEEKDSIWMLPGYMDGISQAGGIPVIFPFTVDREETEQLVNMCDGFLFTGGQDVASELYGEQPLEGLTVDCPKRDGMEALVLEQAMALKKPLLGICRGMQFINVMLGGTLYQDLPLQKPSETVHYQKEPGGVPTHRVRIMEHTPLAELLRKEELEVNSRHHQAVKKLGEGLKVMALSADGLTEAAWYPEYPFLWLLQWHPEYLCDKDENSRALFARFVQSMQ